MFAVPLEAELSVMFEVAEASDAALVEHKALIVSGNVYVWRHSVKTLTSSNDKKNVYITPGKFLPVFETYSNAVDDK
ncbi:hypothetical protein J6590_030308 [Homalodisca vitripennis]|nr:hypothetical protein J6590_030308 [Homalodisca vitripennis]